jgi:hypothetical protein
MPSASASCRWRCSSHCILPTSWGFCFVLLLVCFAFYTLAFRSLAACLDVDFFGCLGFTQLLDLAGYKAESSAESGRVSAIVPLRGSDPFFLPF